MEKIELVNPITVEGKEIKEIELDFSKITGAAMLNAEKSTRTLGEQNPQIMFSQTYQAYIAAKASGVPYKQLCDLPGGDFQKILLAVNRFLFQ